MLTVLLRRCRGAALVLALLVLGTGAAPASHLLGGEMSYRYLDANGAGATPFRYELTVTLYTNGLYASNPATVGEPPAAILVSIYGRPGGALVRSLFIPRTSPGTSQPLPPPVQPRVLPGCAVAGPQQSFYLLKFVQAVSLPASAEGYYAVFTLDARNNPLTNVADRSGAPGGSVPLTLYASLAPPLLPNRSPVFADTAVAIVCRNDTTFTLNNAVDPDGDRLAYAFGAPYGEVNGFNSFPPFPQQVLYNPGFSATNPLGTGSGNFAFIDAGTGVARYGAQASGHYAVAVDVSEYRTINGREVLIGTTRRDVQLVVASCPGTPPVRLPPALITPRSYTVAEGQELRIPITATQATNNPLVLTATSVLLDGADGPFEATFNGNSGTVPAGGLTGTATATGTGAVTGTFVFAPAYGRARPTPYDLALTVKDHGCGGKQAAEVFRITVTRAAGSDAPLKTYNIITPNGDGRNDVLVIDNIQHYPGHTFTIFNRWGREVYRSTNYQNNWGGDANVAPGNYFYRLKLPDGTSRQSWFEVVK